MNTPHTVASVSIQGGATREHPAPPWWLLATIGLLIWLYLAVLAAGSGGVLAAANVAGPITLGVVAAIAAYRTVALHRRAAIWMPYTWFLLAVVLFYSIGPLIYPFAGPRTLSYAMASFFPVGPTQLLRTNLLDAVGVLSIVLGVAAGRQLWRPKRAPSDSGLEPTLHRCAVVAGIFLVAGGALEYLFVLPSYLGLYNAPVPGVVFNLGGLYLLGLMLLSYVVARGRPAWRGPLVLLWAVQIAASLLLFSKHQLLLSVILPPIGAFIWHRRVGRLLMWAVIAVVVYFSISPLVLWGRSQIAAQTGSISRASLPARAHLIFRWVDEGMPSPNRAVPTTGVGWNRLNFAPEQAFAMMQYDNGYPGNTLRYAAIIFVPRFIWPNKPVVTNMGAEFYGLMTGQYGTHLALGTFGEGYWDFGWEGVVMLGLIAGIVFVLLGQLSIGWMQRGSYEYLPSVFLGINMGIVGTTGFFVNYVLGPVGFYFTYALVAYLLVKSTSDVSRRRPSRAGPWLASALGREPRHGS